MRAATVVVFMLGACPALAFEGSPERAIIEACKTIYREDATTAHGHRCPCPDDIKSNGEACDGGSAYRLRGRAKPVCHLKDVTPELKAEITRKGERDALYARCHYSPFHR